MGYKGLEKKKDYFMSVLFNIITITIAREISIYFFNLKDENSYWFSNRILIILPLSLFIIPIINIFYVVLYIG